MIISDKFLSPSILDLIGLGASLGQGNWDLYYGVDNNIKIKTFQS